MNNDLKGLVPDWFSLDKYAIKKDFDLFDYVLNLEKRLIIASNFWNIGEFSKEIKKPNSHKVLKEYAKGLNISVLFNELKEQPIIKKTKAEKINYFKHNPDLKLPPKIKTGNKALQLNTRNIKSLQGDHFRFKEPYHDKTSNYDVMPLCVTQNSLDDYVVYLSLDMTATDNQLIKDFKLVLNEMRKLDHLKFKKGKPITNSNIETWNYFNVIEYMDLSIWFSMNKIKITDPQMARILFPNEIEKDRVQMVRKSTRKIVDEIATLQFMDLAYQQIINEYEQYL